MPNLIQLIAALERHYGNPPLPPARSLFELVMWENACYLMPDERRAVVFADLRANPGLHPEAILSAPDDVLLPIARRGGMRPEIRVQRWREIARITLSQFAGNLDQILSLPYAAAGKALRLFPNIGAPGAEKILLFHGVIQGLPVESNGLRVLTRVGYGTATASYAATYRSVRNAIGAQLPRDAAYLAHAHLLLREHGRTLCRDREPLCGECPVRGQCMHFRSARGSGPAAAARSAAAGRRV